MPFKPRLILRVVWSTDFANGDDLARHVYSRLCRDVERPASRGLGIPVYFHCGPTPTEAGLPGSLDLDAAESTVVISLLDNSIRGNAEWRGCIGEMESRTVASGRRHLFLPIACEDKVLTLVNKTNCVRLYKVGVPEMPARLVAALTHELARLSVVNIDTGRVHATQLSISSRDRNFLLVSGRLAAVTFLQRRGVPGLEGRRGELEQQYRTLAQASE